MNNVIKYFCSFGVCCVFTLSTSGATLTRNSSYIQNPGFPSPYMGGTGVTYTVNKVSSGKRWQVLDKMIGQIITPIFRCLLPKA